MWACLEIKIIKRSGGPDKSRSGSRSGSRSWLDKSRNVGVGVGVVGVGV